MDDKKYIGKNLTALKNGIEYKGRCTSIRKVRAGVQLFLKADDGPGRYFLADELKPAPKAKANKKPDTKEKGFRPWL